MRFRTLSAATTLGIAASLLLAQPSPTQAMETPMCQGQTATIVGTPGQPLRGTTGADVIVANGASRVNGRAGDDTICLDASTTDFVSGGPGDDSVQARSGRGPGLTVLLGPGSDTLDSQGSFDRVYGHTRGMNTDTEVDTISTGGGRDRIFSGAPGQPNNDVIDSGNERDTIDFRGLPGADGSIVTGTKARGDNLRLLDTTGATWKVKMWRNGRIAAGGVSMPVRRGFDLYVRQLGYSKLVVQGTQDLDNVFADRSNNAPRQGRIVTRLVDQVTLRSGAAGRIKGDTDRTFLKFVGRKGEGASVGRLKAHLAQGRVVMDGKRLRVSDIESVEAEGFQRTEYVGTARQDTLYSDACAGYAVGRANGDRLSFQPARSCGRTPGVTLRGGKGPDRLSSGRGNDRLFGGRGRDSGSAGAGRDRCVSIESRRSC